MSETTDGGRIARLQARLDGERVKVRKLLDSQRRTSAERASLLAERAGLERRLAVLESQHDLLLAAPTTNRGSGPALRVLAAGPVRKTIFEFLEGAVITSDPAEAPFDVLVIPRPEKQDLGQLARGIPDAVWSAVRDGRTRLVLDGSSEGRLHRLVVDSFRSLAEQTGASLGEMVYLIQDRLAARRDVPVRVVNYDYYLHKTLHPLLRRGQAAFEKGLARYRKAPRHGRRPQACRTGSRPFGEARQAMA